MDRTDLLVSWLDGILCCLFRFFLDFLQSVAEFEQHANNHPPANVSFRLQPASSLRACAMLKLQVRGGNSGYPLRNQKMLDCKVRAHRCVDDGMDQLIRECTRYMERQIDDANVCITRQGLLATPDGAMPKMGTPLPNRGRGGGVHQYIFRMPPQPGANVDHATPDEQEIACVQNLVSQRAFWTMNLKVQQKRKDLMTEYMYAVGRALRELKSESLDQATEVGSGYADYRLLCHDNQQNYPPN